MKLILDTNSFYHWADIDKKNYVKEKEFQEVIQSSDELGLSILSLYEFFIRHKTRFNFVKQKMAFLKGNIRSFYGYPNEGIVFTNEMLNGIISMRSKTDFDSFVVSVIKKRATVEIKHIYEHLKFILRRYEHSLMYFYEYELQYDTSLLSSDTEADLISLTFSEPWFQVNVGMFQQFRANFIKAATQPLIGTYMQISEHNKKGNMEKFCKNVFDYCLGLYAIELHEEFVKFLIESGSTVGREKRDSGETDKYLQDIRDRQKTKAGCMSTIAAQIKDFGNITRREAVARKLIINDQPIQHSNSFADLGMESRISILNESPLYNYYVIEKTNKNIEQQIKFRKNDIFDSGILNHINDQKDTVVLTLDQKLIELMELVLIRITSAKDISQNTIDNLSQSILLSKKVNQHY